jgi:hypothetical protein
MKQWTCERMRPSKVVMRVTTNYESRDRTFGGCFSQERS